MSRIGKQPVAVPSGVKVKRTADGDRLLLSVEGPKGKLSFPFRKDVDITVDADVIRVSRSGDTAFDRAYHGTARALIANMVQGVSQGFQAPDGSASLVSSWVSAAMSRRARAGSARQ